MTELEPVEIGVAEDVLPLLQSARATTARLTLDLRQLTHQAESAESALEERAQLLRSSLEDRLAEREAELAAELQEVREEAERAIETARADADRLAEEERARAEAVADLASPTHPLRVVPLHPYSPLATAEVLDLDHLPEDLADEDLTDGDEVPDAEDDADGDVRRQAPEDGAFSDEPLDHIGEVIRRAIREGLEDARVAPIAFVPTAAGTAGAVARVGAPSAGPEVAPVAQPSIRQRFLHVDVILPLVAAVIVFVILLAWFA